MVDFEIIFCQFGIFLDAMFNRFSTFLINARLSFSLFLSSCSSSVVLVSFLFPLAAIPGEPADDPMSYRPGGVRASRFNNELSKD